MTTTPSSPEVTTRPEEPTEAAATTNSAATGWTRQRLEQAVQEALRAAGATKLVIVANREPYIHNFENEDIRVQRPAGGLTAALDPVMRACGGLWVAHGSGSADRQTADAHGRIAVPPPPENPTYTLRRIWLSKAEEAGYYYGFANDAFWPLCHIAYQRPRFDQSDWDMYKAVNAKFAAAVLEEISDERALVFVQDYHFALLPRMLKTARPELTVAQFWHIPWPNPEVFRICPWHEEILDGLLGNDLMAFQIQYHANNFFEAVDRFLETKIDRERAAVIRGGHTTLVRPFAISIEPPPPAGEPADQKTVRRQLGVGQLSLLVGVDRADYTKGIPERLRAVDRLLTLYPQWKCRIALVQIGAPSRTHIPAYRELGDLLDRLAEDINYRHGEAGWQPIHLVREHWGPQRIIPLYRAAAVCVVSSLHDGMNLVAKEFVAARDDDRGVLVLSRFTGSARELIDAVLINPYATDDFAHALHQALEMAPDEQERRMRRMRDQVHEHNIYRWAGRLINEAARVMAVRD